MAGIKGPVADDKDAVPIDWGGFDFIAVEPAGKKGRGIGFGGENARSPILFLRFPRATPPGGPMVRFATVLFSTAAIFCLALLFGCAGSPPVEQQAVNCSNYSISDCPSQCVDCLACPNCTGACHTPEFCQNALLNQSLPQNVVPVNNTPGNNTPQNNTPVFAPLPENATVEWEGAATEYLNGPEGSFPEGCAVEQEVDLEIRTGGTELEPDQFDGYVTTKLTKIINCSAIMPDSLNRDRGERPDFRGDKWLDGHFHIGGRGPSRLCGL